MELLDAIKGRRSIRQFSDKKLSKKEIEEIVDAGQWAPSACNKQAWKFIAVTDDRLKNSLVSNAGAISIVKNAPLALAVLYHKKINEKYNANIQSASAAIQNMLLYAHSLGIGSVWLCSYGDARKVRRILQVPDDYLLVAFACFGYPKSVGIKAPKRKELDSILSYNKFSFGDVYPNSYSLNDWSLKQAINYFSDALYATSPTENAYMEGFIGKEVNAQIKLALSSIDNKDKILEIFSYSGKFCLNLLKRKKLDYSILEFDDKIVDFFAQRKNNMGVKHPVKVLLSKDLSIPAKDNSYDKLLFFENLGSIPEHAKLIREMRRVLKPGGKLIISFKNKMSFTKFYHMVCGKGEVSPFEILSLGYVKSLLKGFELIRMHGISLTPFGLGKRSRILKRFSRIIMLECTKK